MDISLVLVARIAYTAFLIFIITKILKWLVNYINLLKVVNKIYAPFTMLPFIGNAHQLKPGSGKLGFNIFD